MITLWAFLIAFLALVIALDLAVFHRRPKSVAVAESLWWGVFFVFLAALVNVGLYFAYEHHWMGAGLAPLGAKGGRQASIEFLTCYLVELALSLDSVYPLAAIVTHFRVPDRLQHRVLFFGLIPAFIVRASLILGGAGVLTVLPWMRFVLAALVVLAALRMILVRQENLDPSRNWIYLLLRRLFPVSEGFAGGNLVTTVGGRTALTSIVVVLLLVETADGLFALDSLPGVFAFSRDPLVIFAANAMAVLTFRSLFFALRPLVAQLRYVKIGLAALLGFIAIAVALPAGREIPDEVALSVLSGSVGVGLLAALAFAGRAGSAAHQSPLGPDAEKIARLTLKQARRIIAFVIGSTIVVVGAIMVPGPGPGLLVIPVGLAILAAEFVWARRLLDKYTSTALAAGKRANQALTATPRPWLIPIVFALTIAAIIVAPRVLPVTYRVILPGAIPLLLGEIVWAFITVRKYRQLKRAAGAQPAPPTLTMPPTTTGPDQQISA